MSTLKIISYGREKEVSFSGEKTLLSVFRENGVILSAPCGGRGKCGKCAVTVLDNGVSTRVLSCQTPAKDGMTVLLSDSEGSGLTTDALFAETDKKTGVGLALDVGTTTLAFYFVDLFTGKTLKTASCLNPQRSFGADVVSRIAFCQKEGPKLMTDALRTAVNDVISSFKRESDVKKIERAFITGNTVMLHLFSGKDVSSFGTYPFTPLFLEKQCFTGETLGYDAEEIVLLPSFSSFVGADIVCGGLAVDISSGNRLLIDLGTNGEMLLSYHGKLYSTSVAAGPAFEGADMECGTGGIPGAIDRVYTDENGSVRFTTVENAPPIGICGAGIADAMAVMQKSGVIDETGAFLPEENKFFLSENVYISDKDVRKFQLAKSAVRAGIETLLSVARAKENDLEKCFVAGGLGYYLNVDSAVTIGLFPKNLREKIVLSGNTAGLGAKLCLLSAGFLKKAEDTAKNAENVPLASSAVFSEKFMEYMTFGEN